MAAPWAGGTRVVPSAKRWNTATTDAALVPGMKVFIAGVWQEKPVKVWMGTEWVVKPLRYWNGTVWV